MLCGLYDQEFNIDMLPQCMQHDRVCSEGILGLVVQSETVVTDEFPLHVLPKVEQILNLVPFVTKQARDPSPRTTRLSRPVLRGLQQD